MMTATSLLDTASQQQDIVHVFRQLHQQAQDAPNAKVRKMLLAVACRFAELTFEPYGPDRARSA